MPKKSIEIATNDAIEKTEEQLNKELSMQGKEEIRQGMKTRTEKLRASIIESFLILINTIIYARLTAYALIYSGIIVSLTILNGIRLFSVSLILWATLGKLGWEIQSYKGKTLPEKINRHWFRVLYIIGVFLAAITYFL